MCHFSVSGEVGSGGLVKELGSEKKAVNNEIFLNQRLRGWKGVGGWMAKIGFVGGGGELGGQA